MPSPWAPQGRRVCRSVPTRSSWCPTALRRRSVFASAIGPSSQPARQRVPRRWPCRGSGFTTQA
ncbi:hypothetical protein AKJ08_0660 [Vulgatibacter incomptus]|uniref:Uncharacterized protein n=1 Tax=Vulgatibacter incomptus TaxID=1391653 RepID=A0A0K1P9R7_9BACT|nr:hypothetical protein AKJ08_0660 [Vulgatibacter incomptus]